MKEFKTSIEISASPETVWSTLLDTAAWPEWDPFTEKIEGTVALGHKVKAFSKLSPGRGFGVKVTKLVPHETMVWTGGMPFGLFKGERTYTLAAGPRGTTTFAMREVFGGPMLALIGKSIPDMTEAFESFANGLKARAESRER
jgi:hypothetical protein